MVFFFFRSRALMVAGLAALLMSGALSWFAVRDYRLALPLSLENLRGLALTMATAMEGVAARDPSLQSWKGFQTPEVAYIVLIDGEGRILFHSNSELIGAGVRDVRYHGVLQGRGLSEERIVLATGESVYEFQTLAHVEDQVCVLRLALHTWRAETVMRRARQAMGTVFSLLAVGWGLGLVVVWLLWRQSEREHYLARRQELERLGEVGAVLAHELRNPLAGIKGYGQLLEERLADGRERQFATLIVREAWRLERLARDILLYTRSGMVKQGACQPAAVVATVVSLLASQIQEKEIDVSCDVAESVWLACPADSFQQVLLNVLDNALQAVLPGGLVRVSAKRVAGNSQVEIRVSDTGPGIAKEMEDVLFEPFHTSRARGAGLGLAVCRKIVEACGGNIALRTGRDGGAECLIRLPAAMAQVEENG